MSNIENEVVQAILVVIITVITRYLIPWLKENKKVKSLVTKSEELLASSEWARKIVYAVEQRFSSSTGEERKSIAIKMLEDIAKEKNLPVSDTQIEILIEDAVKAMNIVKEQNKAVIK